MSTVSGGWLPFVIVLAAPFASYRVSRVVRLGVLVVVVRFTISPCAATSLLVTGLMPWLTGLLVVVPL